jgi:hypothetical protein
MPSERTLLGIIVDIDDPLKQGRAKIRAFGFFEDIPVEDLPWAEQIAGLSFGGEGGGGALTVPRLGAVVAVHFEEHNFYKMIYHYIKEISSDLLDKMQEDNCYIGANYLMYDSEAKPGPLHMYYTYKDGLVFELDNAKVQLDTQNGGQLRVVVKMGNDEIRMENSKVIIESGNIELGSGARTLEKVILGDTFLSFFNQHTHATPAGPSSPPASPMTTAQLSFITKTR